MTLPQHFGLLVCVAVLTPSLSVAQETGAFDYRIPRVYMIRTDPATGDTTRLAELEAYLLYDIGSTPTVRFEVEVEQVERPSPEARRVDLVVERYLLIESRENAYYETVDTLHGDLVAETPRWSYHGPVTLSYDRIRTDSGDYRFVTEPYRIDFLDPAEPLTQAYPLAYSILAYAYRFVLVPSSPAYRDTCPSDNAYQLTFRRP